MIRFLSKFLNKYFFGLHLVEFPRPCLLPTSILRCVFLPLAIFSTIVAGITVTVVIVLIIVYTHSIIIVFMIVVEIVGAVFVTVISEVFVFEFVLLLVLFEKVLETLAYLMIRLGPLILSYLLILLLNLL